MHRVGRRGQLGYPDENGDWQQIPWTAGDLVYLHANSDNYVVSQPSGRKAMITVEHGSSRMSPCFMETPTLPDGDSPPPWQSCDPDGAPCGWVTDTYSHDRDRDGPLFDYSATGKFKTGLMSVKAHSVGLLVWIRHEDGSSDQYFIEEGSYAMTSTTIKAVSYR